jgi:hypothetical protein
VIFENYRNKTRRNIIKNYIFREQVGIQSLLIELERKEFQQLDHIKRLDIIRKSRMAIARSTQPPEYN